MELTNVSKEIIDKVGGKENILSVTHCMTRLRFKIKDLYKVKEDELKSISEIAGVVNKAGQLQLIIGPQVVNYYDEVVKLVGDISEKEAEVQVKGTNGEKKSIKNILNNILGTLAGCMTPLIPILLCAGLSKTIASCIGPQLLNLVSETDSLYVLFTFVGDAGFYFLPIYLGYTAAKQFNCNPIMGLFLAGIYIHPTLINMANEGTSFSVYGIPAAAQNYTGSVIPIILSVWVMGYVERLLKKHSRELLKVLVIPFGTLLVMLPLALCLFGPIGSFLGNYICNGILGLYDIAGPLALGIVGATFSLLVMTGMHSLLFSFLFMTFPIVGYDNFILPAILACSWAGAGTALACIVKFKNKEKKAMTFGYFISWIFGGVGEPLLYGLNVPYKTPMYAGIISGFITGVAAGFLNLTAYVLNPSNGIYLLPAFFGGDKSNYISLILTLVIGLVSGFLVMWFMKLDENVK